MGRHLASGFALAALACGSPETVPAAADVANTEPPAPLPPPPPPDPARDPARAPDAGLPGPRASYDVDGPRSVVTSRERVTGARSFEVVVHRPETSAPVPVVVLASGSTQTAAFYAAYARRLASHGIAAVLRDDPGPLVQTREVAEDVTAVVEAWMPTRSTFDLGRVGLAGHSRGGAATLLALQGALRGKARAWFGLDPVDNQFLVGPGAFARTQMARVDVPTVFLGAEVASNCAPRADGWEVLFPAARAPSVLLVGVGAGHMQLGAASACTACAACTPAGTAARETVLAYAVRYLTAFFARELLFDLAVGPAFEGAGADADVTLGRVTLRAR